MKVYIVSPAEHYSGGAILIAANNKREAKSFVPTNFVEFTEPEEVKDLVANVSEPKVIFDLIYVE